jgi:hypothetical protein
MDESGIYCRLLYTGRTVKIKPLFRLEIMNGPDDSLTKDKECMRSVGFVISVLF